MTFIIRKRVGGNNCSRANLQVFVRADAIAAHINHDLPNEEREREKSARRHHYHYLKQNLCCDVKVNEMKYNFHKRRNQRDFSSRFLLDKF